MERVYAIGYTLSMTLTVEQFKALDVAEKMDYLYEKLLPFLEKQDNAGFWASRRAKANA